jgi:hypothetical protein
MTRNKHLIITGSAVILAFAAGRLTLIGATSPASASDPPQPPDLAAEMQACLDAGTPGAAHAQLEPLVGEWEMSIKMWQRPGLEPMQVTGLLRREWVLDKHYLRETVESESDWGSFQGLGYLGYDNLDGQYQTIWLDNMSTAIMSSTGSYDASRKVLSFRGSHRDPLTRALRSTRGTLDLSNPDRHIYAEYITGPDGKEFLAFEGIAQRRR